MLGLTCNLGMTTVKCTNLVKSVYDSQDELLSCMLNLHSNGSVELDASYGNGTFYKNIPEPVYKYDLDESLDCDIASSSNLPIGDSYVGSIMFDPPFLTYVRSGRVGNGSMIMSNRFSGYWSYSELENHYKESLHEFYRVLKPRGKVFFKCQDIVHNHKLVPTHINVVMWASEAGLRLKDMFVLAAKHRLPSPNRKGVQKHARIYHSYFLVLEK